MTDARFIALIGAGVTVVSSITGLLTNIILKRIGTYRREVNGHMSDYIQTAKELGRKEGAETNQTETNAKPQNEK